MKEEESQETKEDTKKGTVVYLHTFFSIGV